MPVLLLIIGLACIAVAFIWGAIEYMRGLRSGKYKL